MIREDFPELRNRILQHLTDKYKLSEVREPNHLSGYVYCLTKGYFDHFQPAEPTEEEIMLFSLGYGLQEVLTPSDTTAPLIEKEGIIYRPDMVFDGFGMKVTMNGLCELKTTRKSAKLHYSDGALPDTWIDYMKGGCFLMDTDIYNLVVLYMMGNYAPPFPKLFADRITFSTDEIENNWYRIETRRDIMDKAFKEGKPPKPFSTNYDWECKYCRYNLLCSSIANIL